MDAVIVGAGFAGLYMLHKLRGQGMTAHLYEAAPEVGGTWYWNRYPGARCDVESLDYSYSFDDDLQQEWKWTERYPAQPEILAYLKHVADRFDLRRDISLNTKVTEAHYDSGNATWQVRTDTGETTTANHLILATGCLSVPKKPELPGLGNFRGPVYHTAEWPESGVDFTGLRVGVFGTGSSGVQAIPEIAKQALELTVFQRTPAYSVPAFNGPLDPEKEREVKANYAERRRQNRLSEAGVVRGDNPQCAYDVDAEQRRREYESRWDKGGFGILGAYADLMADQAANDTAADFIRGKISEMVHDQELAERLKPRDYALGTKRICVDTNYYDTYNSGHVTLVDLRSTPLETITEKGVRTSDGEVELDALVLATGFDAMTGAVNRIDIRGRDGLVLKEKWAHGPRTYLGVGTAGFPNLFMLAGPGSPSVLTNMVTAIEQHVEWTADCLAHLRDHSYRSIEATPEAEDEWVNHVNEVADMTLFPKAASWYMGANVPGKPRIFMPYAGGFVTYENTCKDVVANGYRGFVLK